MKTPKTILHIINSLGNGGAEKNLLRLCLSDKKNINLIVTLKSINFYKHLLKKNKIKVINLEILKKPISGIQKLLYIIKKENPSIIMSWMYHSCFLILIINKFLDKKIKKIWNIRHSNVILFKTKIFTYLLAKYILSIFSNMPHKIIYNSNYSKKIHSAYGYHKKKALVIHNGYKKRNFIKKKTNQKFYFGFIGRYSPQKNFLFLFKIISYLKKKNMDFKFYFVGSNLSLQNVNLVKDLEKFNIKDKIIFLKTKIDISAYFNLFDITVSTSNYGESFPNIIAESLLASTPCLAVNFGENKIILNKGGYLYKKNNIHDFYQKFKKIKILMKNKKKWNSFRKEGYNNIVYNFSINKMLKKYFKVYER